MAYREIAVVEREKERERGNNSFVRSGVTKIEKWGRVFGISILDKGDRRVQASGLAMSTVVCGSEVFAITPFAGFDSKHMQNNYSLWITKNKENNTKLSTKTYLYSPIEATTKMRLTRQLS